MQSALLRINIQLRFLVLRLHIVRCRLLANSEDNLAIQQQILALLHALEAAEAQLRTEYNRCCATSSAVDHGHSAADASPLDGDITNHSKDSKSHMIIDLNAARNARTRLKRPFHTRRFQTDPTLM
jgi:hypothetical protein